MHILSLSYSWSEHISSGARCGTEKYLLLPSGCGMAGVRYTPDGKAGCCSGEIN
jgi:hypothetical protein